MSAPCHLRRIRLVNVHNLVDETLPVRRNLFLIGDNQSGKTTVLDAVHFALSAGVEMEFNAAARFGPRSEAGRNLASIVLRYDLERDVAQRGPSVLYAALEIAGEAGEVHCFGAGAFASSLDAQPDVWGFVARDRTLEEVELCVEEPDGAGGLRRRPRDREELEQRLGRGAVLDKGRYRTAVAKLLCRDRDAYERALDLIAAGKAYREMAARARSLDELFIGLLPPPAEAELEEVRSALRAIEGIRSDLGDLESELGVLRRVIEKLQETRDETEKMTRYELVGAELWRRTAAAALAERRRQQEETATGAATAEETRRTAAAEVARLDGELRDLQASEGAALLAREEEARRDTAEAGQELERAREELALRQEERRSAAAAAASTAAEAERARQRAFAALRSVSNASRLHLGDQGALALDALADAVAALEPLPEESRGLPPLGGAAAGRATAGPPAELPPAAPIERPLAFLRRGFETAREAATGSAAVAADEAQRLAAAGAATVAAADEVRRLREMPLELPGYGALLAALAAAAPRAVPLYRLFELVPGAPETWGAGIECMLGPRLLGAIVAPPEEHTTARALVLAHGAGVEVVDPSAPGPAAPGSGGDPGAADPTGRPPVTLPDLLADAGSADQALHARRFLCRAAGDVLILAGGPGEEGGGSRGEAERAIWMDGHLYEHGAESRVEPYPPRWLGEAARARAAAQEETRLRELAAEHRAGSERAATEAAVHRQVAQACGEALDELTACAPGPLLALGAAAARADAALREREAAAQPAVERASRTARHLERRRARLATIVAAVTHAGGAGLRERIDRVGEGLARARTAEKAAIAEAAEARAAAERCAAAATEAEQLLDAAATGVQERRDALLPLVPERYRGDLDDYAFRIMRGHQIVASNVPALVTEASNARARAFQWLESSDGLRHERLWQKFGFRLLEEPREVRDQGGRPVEEIYAGRQVEVRALQAALDEKTRDLLERVVMAGLVRRLQGQVRELRETIQGINRLIGDLRFGASRFQFSLRQRPEMQRLLELLREQSVLQPALQEELRDFFQARLDDLRQTPTGEVPEVLDYRRWFEYVLQVQSRGAGAAAQDLSRNRLRFGSTGEQAVPNYLLVLAVASLLYDRTEARLRLLLLDEAFLGIDAGRREVLLQFADRAGVDLIVATPELDGLTPALAASSTLFIEKTPEQDVFVSDFHWERPGAQQGLFERGEAEPAESAMVLGVREGPDPAAEAAVGGDPDGRPAAWRPA